MYNIHIFLSTRRVLVFKQIGYWASKFYIITQKEWRNIVQKHALEKIEKKAGTCFANALGKI